MIKNFFYGNVVFRKHSEADWLVVKGEITNNAGRSYQAVVFRIVVFLKSVPVGSSSFTINGFFNGQTRTFEKKIEELEYSSLVKDALNYEIYAESAY